MLTPIHIVEIDGKPLRFFASPLYTAHRQADWPWHSGDDLRAILRLPEELQTLFRQRIKESWGEVVRTVATPDGITTIEPNYMGEGILGFMQYRRKLLPTAERHRIRGRYRNGVTKSMMEMLKHLPPAERMIAALSAER